MDNETTYLVTLGVFSIWAHDFVMWTTHLAYEFLRRYRARRSATLNEVEGGVS